MFFDILLIVIVVLCAVFGFRSGFIISLSRIGGWVGALVIAFFYADEVEAWTLAHTDWFDNLKNHTLKVCHSFIDQYGSGLADKLPDGFGDFIEHMGDMLAVESAEKITQHAFPILVFVGIVFAIKIVLFILTLLLSKKFHGGFIGGVDSFVGLL
ncbi:MAG: CvpA family protein, partial [Clostridiales Family XIII bacterium]|nr:CvpA family protein [Clostridiales Family XIII bacterium]